MMNMYRYPNYEDVHLPQLFDEVVDKNSDENAGTENLHWEWRNEDFVLDEADKEATWIGKDEVLTMRILPAYDNHDTFFVIFLVYGIEIAHINPSDLPGESMLLVGSPQFNVMLLMILTF